VRRSNPILPALLGRNADGLPFSEEFGDILPPAAEALRRAEQVFLAGNQLPARWTGQTRHVILETGFGPGHNFLATWAAWRRDPRRCDRLIYLAIEKHPLARADLAELHRDSAHSDQAAQLIAAWPPATPDLHLLDFEGGRVQLMLALGDIHDVLAGLQAEVHSLYLDGYAPERNPAMWTADVFKRIARMAAPGAMAACSHSDSAVRDGLARQGFEVHAADTADQLNTTVARYAPRFRPEPPRGLRWPQAAAREALVIGGGLAGCAVAQALALQGWQSTVIDRHAAPAQETSGNAGGLMHGIFNAPDSPHARWFRAGALLAAKAGSTALASGDVAGSLAGMLRLDERLGDAQAAAQLDAVGLPRAWLDWIDRAGACAAAGLELPSGAWHYAAAGWLDPAGYSRWMLQQAGRAARWLGGTEVAALRGPHDGMTGWQAIAADGRVIASAPVVVLANALDAARLLPPGSAPLRLSASRGQVTRIPADTPGLHVPDLTVAGQGYALRLPGGEVLVGATTQDEMPSPDGAALRLADQQHNLQRAAGLGVLDGSTPDFGTTLLPGRAGWRAVTADRLPLVGPPIDLAMLAAARGGRVRLDARRHQPRWVDDRSGLYLCTGLGSRGITSAALAGRLLAAWVSGAPCPVDADLRNALDPARLSN
jgi:tRNA 5-methylaminomethyl-2-thiouridine biosynthesis bifunctional protein